MKAFLWMIVTAAIGLVSPVIAADMPVKAPLYTPPVAAQSWTGFYVSIDGGPNLGSFNPLFGTGPEATTVNLDDNSWFVGGNMRYLFQSGGLVIGPELGIQYWGIKGKSDIAVSQEAVATLQQKVDWIVYANVLAGISPFTNTLLYVTGGAAWAHSKTTAVDLGDINVALTQTAMGWNAGAGIAFKLNETVGLGLQYTHFDFGTPEAIALLGGTKSMTVDQIKGAVSFKLN